MFLGRNNPSKFGNRLQLAQIQQKITLSSMIGQAISMADAMFMYTITAGVFAFLVAILFGARGARRRRGSGEDHVEPESHPSSSSGDVGMRIKKFKSDGTPVHE
jgi:hypothetical protein